MGKEEMALRLQSHEILISVLLAILVTVGSAFYAPDSVCEFRSNCNRGINPTTYHGLPLKFMESSLYAGSKIEFWNLILDFLFWFLISAGGLWMLKKLKFERSKKRKHNSKYHYHLKLFTSQLAAPFSSLPSYRLRRLNLVL